MDKLSFSKPPWLITGATDGIGLALAAEMQEAGEALILLGRKPLAALTNPLFTEENYLCADLVAPDAVAHILTWLQARGISSLTGVVHNAAGGYVGELRQQTPECVQEIMQTNVVVPILLTHALAACSQRFVFISSVVAEWGAAAYGVYAASKAALNAFCRSLRAEQPQYFVQTLHLGAVRTELHSKCGWKISPTQLAKFPPPANAAKWLWRQMQSRSPQATMGVVNQLVRWAGEWMKFPLSGRHASRAVKSTQPHVLITGGAQGIGLALVAEFQRCGALVTSVDLNHSTTLGTVPLDLAQPASWHSLWAPLSALPPVDVVIHNAGINATGSFEQISAEALERVLVVNLTAPLRLNAELWQRGYLPPEAHFIFISSLSYYSGYPGASVYAATKAGLAAYGNSVRRAVTPGRGRALVVFPGPVRTAHAREYSPDNKYEHKRMEPAVLAGKIRAACHRGAKRLIPGAGNKFSSLLGWALPSAMTRLMRKLLFTKMCPPPKGPKGGRSR